MVFDVLYVNGHSLLTRPLEDSPHASSRRDPCRKIPRRRNCPRDCTGRASRWRIGTFIPIGTLKARAVDAPFPLHHDAFESHERARFHQPLTLRGREPLGQFHLIRLQRRLELPQDRACRSSRS